MPDLPWDIASLLHIIMFLSWKLKIAFVATKINIDCDEQIFISINEINELRRNLVEKLIKFENLKPISLGKRILRTETAPLYIMSVFGFIGEQYDN